MPGPKYFVSKQSLTQIIQIFDSWAGELSPTDFVRFSLPYLLQIPSRVHKALAQRGYYPSNPQVPTIVFAKGAWYALEHLAKSEYDVISLDWTHDPEQARKRAGGKVLQGNMDPNGLYGPKEHITSEVERIVHGFGGGKERYIVNLGHGITPVRILCGRCLFQGVDPDNLRWFLQESHRISAM